MKQEFITWGLGVLSTILGGVKLYDLLYHRETRSRLAAESSKALVEAKRAELDLRQDEAAGLQAQCDRLFKQMMDMQATLQQSIMEVAELKGLVASKDAIITRLTREIEYFKLENNRLTAELKKQHETIN
ncbi:MAG: hypothetical protein RR202_10585 [Bacteroidales bacterium]